MQHLLYKINNILVFGQVIYTKYRKGLEQEVRDDKEDYQSLSYAVGFNEVEGNEKRNTH